MKLVNPIKDQISFTSVGTGHSQIVLIWSSSIWIPFRVTINPRYSIVSVLKVHLLNLAYSLKVQSLSITSQICFLCSSLMLEYMTMSSKQTTTQVSNRSNMAQLIYAQNIIGALANPKGITKYSRYLYLIQKVVFHLSPSLIHMW